MPSLCKTKGLKPAPRQRCQRRLLADRPVLNVPENADAVMPKHRVRIDAVDGGFGDIVRVDVADKGVGRIVRERVQEFAVILLTDGVVAALACECQIFVHPRGAFGMEFICLGLILLALLVRIIMVFM